MMDERIIIDETTNWVAIIEFNDYFANLYFETKKSELLQGEVDETLGFDPIPTGISDFELEVDDDRFIVFYDNEDPTILPRYKNEIFNYLKQTYENNKTEFIKNIELTIVNY